MEESIVEERIMPESMSSLEMNSKTEQGFLTNEDDFVDRVEAKKIAREADQLLDRASPLKYLFSEDLW